MPTEPVKSAALRTFGRALVVGLCLLPAWCFAWAVNARELVDLEYAGSDESLAILISVPSTTPAGLYRWSANDPQPVRLCRIASPSFFSFDRKTVIERVRGATSWLRLYHPGNCRLLARIKVDGYALDADVRGANVIVAVRDVDKNYTLRLYSRRGKLLASTAIGRNVEVGIAADARHVVNFDLSDSGARLWSLPRLRPTELPQWAQDGEFTFVPGSAFAKRYLDGRLHVVRWPSGVAIHTVSASRSARLRQLSKAGHFGILHERTEHDDLIDWIDFANNRRTTLARGSIDNAALHGSGKFVAWSARSIGTDDAASHRVDIRRARIDASGITPLAE